MPNIVIPFVVSHTVNVLLGPFVRSAETCSPQSFPCACMQDDRKHRAAWREVYTPQECGQLKELIDACGERGIGFVYGIAPGLDIVHR